MNSQFPFLEMESKKDNMYNDSDFSEKKYKKFKKFEKFIPKNVNDQEKNQKELKGAENKVKSLLSILPSIFMSAFFNKFSSVIT